ncbi:hypothetical protein HPB47_000991 [Ixodes persulcatus]|uniref:Uncharacterized protein n=1 Tax=Ixodes persulcatus TaxID=34615 RepID=A0AC60PRS2_IXOPE|nr:hypothetical protein HPB47_000991 [Ixodes persulcatus]
MALEDRTKLPLEPRPNIVTTLAAAAAAAMPEPPANDQSPAEMEPNPNDDTMEFDELSGRTLSHPGPWKQMLSDRRKSKQQAFSTNTQPAPGKPNSSSRVPRAPRLPDTDYKVIYRPRDGLRIAAWSDRQLTASIQKASRIPEGAFNQRVVIQVQAVQNLIVASTPYDTYTDALSDVTSLQLENATYEISPYVKPFPGTVRGVIHGLDPGTTTEQLPNIIASPGPKIQQARMLGKSTSAVVTFEGPHVPFYIHAHGLYTRCRPYRHSIQCCSLCGDIGHRRDICPNPEVIVCERKDCRKKLRPPPPPLHVRERLARTTPTFQRQPHHQVPAAHPAPPPQAQANTQRRHSPSQQGSWSTIVAPPETAPNDFPPLPAQLASVQDKNSCIKILERENAQLRKELELQAERTERLERRIEELVTHLETITNPPAQSAPSAVPTLQDIGRLERLIHDLGQTIERLIDAIEKRQEASETVKRKTRKTKQPAPSDPPTITPSDDEWEQSRSGEP